MGASNNSNFVMPEEGSIPFRKNASLRSKGTALFNKTSGYRPAPVWRIISGALIYRLRKFSQIA
jgi:hypothetical protein